ncbi:AMP-binding protein [Alcaligenaceae bacterium]|nr:AMP-binding protein [Alcaligenaceae bacterium]
MNQTSHQRFVAARDFLQLHRTDYDTAVQEFRWPKLDEFNWALDYFDVIAQDNNDPALWIVGEDGSNEKWSYAQLSERSARVANWLNRLGVCRGDCILLMLGNERPLWEVMLAALKLGAVVIPASTLLSREDLLDRFERGRVRHVIVGEDQVDKFASLPGDYTRIKVGAKQDGWHTYDQAYEASANFLPLDKTLATDPLLLYFTSGTTSKPKLVLHSHQSYPVGHLSTMYWLGLQRDDVHLNVSSPGWAKHAWSCLFAPWNAGSCVFIYNSERFSAKALLDVLQEHGVTTMCAPPTVYRMLMQEDLKNRKLSLRELIGAGEPLNPEIISRFQDAWGLTLRDGFGQTETTCQIGNTPGQAVKPGSMGRPLPGYDITFVQADQETDDEGEICIKLGVGVHAPVGLMLGYSDDDAKTSEVMRNGRYHTGDIAQRDADGYITYVGRADDVFKASDYRISPFELESVLIEHEAVAEAAVIPSPDPLRHAIPKAIVMLSPGQTPSDALARDILAFCRDRLAPYKRIRCIEFAELPKTISGKIRRAQLRQHEAERRAKDERHPLEFFEGD